MFLFLWCLLATVYCLPLDRHERHYYIAAESVEWNYAPMQWDNVRDQPLTEPPSALYAASTPEFLGSTYVKAIYQQYRDKSFDVRVPHDPTLGLLGPVLRAEAGDQIHVHFMNKGKHPHSLHPHHPDGVFLPPVLPGDTYEYVWDIPADYPFPNNQSVVWMYHSHTNADTNAGLIGFIVLYPRHTLQYASPGSMFPQPSGIDQEVFTLMTTTDEMQSSYWESSLALTHKSSVNSSLFKESNRMYHVNGYIYNNNPTFMLEWGSRVRWYVVSYGVADIDPHTAHWHGATLLYHGHRVDVVDLSPVSFEVLDMVPDNTGLWLFHCHVASHFEAGMSAFYQVDRTVHTGDEGWE